MPLRLPWREALPDECRTGCVRLTVRGCECVVFQKMKNLSYMFVNASIVMREPTMSG